MEQEIAQHLDALAANMGVAVDVIWQALLVQARIEFWLALVTTLVLAVLTGAFSWAYFRLTQARKHAIYNAVHDPLMDARIAVAQLFNGHPQGERLDEILYGAQCKAASAAVRAAEGGSHG